MRAIPKAAVDFIAAHEGVKLRAYLDSANVPTIGYGHINGVVMGQVCTKEQAREWLSADLAATRRKLYGVVKDVVIDELTENQWSALLSFVFNLGADSKWTIWKRLNARQFDQVPGEMMRFVNAGGKKVQGLVNRRADEVKLWSTDEPGSVAQELPSSVTREAPTPPTPVDPTPVHKSGALIATATAAIAGVPAAVGQVTQAIAPYAANSDLVQKMLSTLSVVAAGSVILGLVFTWVKKREAR